MKSRKRFSCFVGAAAALATVVAAESPKVTGIAQVTFYAKDLAASRAFYTGLLGYEERSNGVFQINDRQSVRLVAEKQAGSDRLVSITFATEQAASPSTTTDPDGHAIEFVGRGRLRAAGASASQAAPRLTTAAVSTDLRHAGIIVASLGSAMTFYVDTLGFRETWRGSRDEKTLDWVNVQVPGGEDYIEFMLYRDLPAPDRRGTQHHICLFVPDLDKAAAFVAARAPAGGYSRPLEIRTGTNRRRQLNLYDPDGTRIELMEDHTVDGKPAASSTAAPPRP